jgi:hypothetical protein
MITTVVLLLFFLQGANPPTPPDIPGVYFLQKSSGWMALNPAPVVEMKTKGMKIFVDSGGYTNLGMSIFFRGAKASRRILDPIPRFFVRKDGASKNVILVRLLKKKDQRACQTSPSAATMENKKGFKKEDVLKMGVIEYPDGSFSAIPESTLKPGEYLLVMGDTTSIYDFGID